MKAKKPNKKPRATNAIRELRIHAIMQLRLEGAETWDCVSYVSDLEANGEHPWTIPKGGKPLSERQKRRYVEKAGKRIAETCRTHDPNAIYLHIAQRERLYAKAVQAGDIRTALAVLKDLDKLLGQYPAQKLKAAPSGDLKIEIIGVDDFYGNGPSRERNKNEIADGSARTRADVSPGKDPPIE